MQRVKAVTSNAAAYIQHWGCGPDLPEREFLVLREMLREDVTYAAMETEPEAVRMSALLLIAAGRSPARVPTCEHALRHVRTNFIPDEDMEDDWFMADRTQYDLRFEEWPDDYDLPTSVLREMRRPRHDDFSPVLVRALSLFGPSELRALRVLDPTTFRLVTSLGRTASVSGCGEIEQTMDSLCALQVADYTSHDPNIHIGSLAAFLKRHSSTITELDVQIALSQPRAMLNEAASALACCTRLESLTCASSHDPSIWLGLSQLHTLRGVDLGKVSVAAIATALPKLHTLEAFSYCDDPARAAGFFTDLLPRLRVFHFAMEWPDVQDQSASTMIAPLPLLQELAWDVSGRSENFAPREFLGAQPAVLHAPYSLISECCVSAVDEAASFLARVCDLHITAAFDMDPLDPSDVARLLRAAPRVKKIHTDHLVHGGGSWLAPTAPTHPAFEGLVHPRLREFGIGCAEAEEDDMSDATPPNDEWAGHLQRRHFPRLRELVIGPYSVTPPDDVLPTGAAVEIG
jgi:hypothetical protein